MQKYLMRTDHLKIEQALNDVLKPCKLTERLHIHNTTIYGELKHKTYTYLNSDLTTEEQYSPDIAEAIYCENLKVKAEN